MRIDLPGPVAFRLDDWDYCDDEVVIHFRVRDAGHADAVDALLTKAQRRGYSLRIELIHYEGQPDMPEQARARWERKGR